MTTATDPLADALATTSTWKVDHVASAVVGPGGTRAAHGPQDRPFWLASVTKLLTSYAALIAIEEGTMDLDEPAGPEGSTVRHLFAHTGGYGFDSKPMATPGRRRIYSNTGMDALGAHLADRAGMSIHDYLREGVFDPLGMTGIDFRSPSVAQGAWGTVGDLSLFARELLAPTLVDPSTLAVATQVQFPGLDGVLPGIGHQSPNDWGLGFEIRAHKSPHWTGLDNSPATFGHFGGGGTFLWIDPAVGHGLVALTDRGFGPWAMTAWPDLSDAVLAALSG